MHFMAIPERDCRISLFSGREDLWSVGRNGGAMADFQQKLRPNKTTGKTGSTTRKKRRAKPVGGNTACKDGVEQLRVAADWWLGQKSAEIAEALSNSAVKGDLASTKALVSLADGKKVSPEEVKKLSGPSMAQRLAAEAQWQGKEGGSNGQGTE
jgi:hypothetical protein